MGELYSFINFLSEESNADKDCIFIIVVISLKLKLVKMI